MIWRFFNNRFPSRIAVDLGTANTRIYSSGPGIVEERESWISPFNNPSKPAENKSYLIFPLQGGVIVDLKNAEMLLRPLIQKNKGLWRHPITLACAPTDTTRKERDLLSQALIHAGSSHVSIIPEVWAGAIGAGLDLTSPYGQVLIDIGKGVTDLAVFRDGDIVFSSAIRVACGDLQESISQAIMNKYEIQLCPREAERLSSEAIWTLVSSRDDHTMLSARGIDPVKGDMLSFPVDRKFLADEISPVVDKILDLVENSLKGLSGKTYCEVLESGVWLTGGGACLKGLDRLIFLRTDMKVSIAASPLRAVINGAIGALKYWQPQKKWGKNIVWPS